MYRLIQRVPATLAFMAHACQTVQMASLARAVRDIRVRINDVGVSMNRGDEEGGGNTSTHKP